MFRVLNEQEVEDFKAWARENYEPYDVINGIWHPVVQAECVAINEKASELQRIGFSGEAAKKLA